MRSNEPSVEEFLKASKNLKATTSLAEGVNHSDVIFILVDTPSTGGERCAIAPLYCLFSPPALLCCRHYDHSKLGSVLSAINNLKPTGKHIVIGCTVRIDIGWQCLSLIARACFQVLPGYIAQVGRFLIADCKDCSLRCAPAYRRGDGPLVHSHGSGSVQLQPRVHCSGRHYQWPAETRHGTSNCHVIVLQPTVV
jgi:hypothetical protein